MLTYKEFREQCPKLDLSEGVFLSLQRRIKRRIDFLTFERIKDNDLNLQKRVDEVIIDILNELYFSDIGFLKDNESDSSSNIKSESVGEYKIEYASANTLSSDKKDGLMASLIDERIREAFVHTGLMYRGIYEN
ncbi:hypothetical protein [Anaerococcus vaginalis]|uniref:hypothetical protein n=1 Tax=Anaerococcus vaginalis TaxID=33037 RepID=UPI0022DEFBD1|nr:hypothetical protein [Anaerococcus vaginalis]